MKCCNLICIVMYILNHVVFKQMQKLNNKNRVHTRLQDCLCDKILLHSSLIYVLETELTAQIFHSCLN